MEHRFALTLSLVSILWTGLARADERLDKLTARIKRHLVRVSADVSSGAAPRDPDTVLGIAGVKTDDKVQLVVKVDVDIDSESFRSRMSGLVKSEGDRAPAAIGDALTSRMLSAENERRNANWSFVIGANERKPRIDYFLRMEPDISWFPPPKLLETFQQAGLAGPEARAALEKALGDGDWKPKPALSATVLHLVDKAKPCPFMLGAKLEEVSFGGNDPDGKPVEHVARACLNKKALFEALKTLPMRHADHAIMQLVYSYNLISAHWGSLSTKGPQDLVNQLVGELDAYLGRPKRERSPLFQRESFPDNTRNELTNYYPDEPFPGAGSPPAATARKATHR